MESRAKVIDFLQDMIDGIEANERGFAEQHHMPYTAEDGIWAQAIDQFRSRLANLTINPSTKRY